MAAKTNADSFNILLGCTGSVAALKLPKLVEALTTPSTYKINVQVKVVVTEHCKHFVDVSNIACKVYTDDDEWSMWQERGDPVLHVELRKWAHVMLIAPLDANTMAKLASGICDNLLTCVVRAWDRTRPLFFAPAMNTFMWKHSITEEHLAKLESFGYQQIPPISKTLMCGDTGPGAMAEVKTLVDRVLALIEPR